MSLPQEKLPQLAGASDDFSVGGFAKPCSGSRPPTGTAAISLSPWENLAHNIKQRHQDWEQGWLNYMAHPRLLLSRKRLSSMALGAQSGTSEGGPARLGLLWALGNLGQVI